MSFNQIPEQLFDANISLRAKWLWMLLAKHAKPEAIEFWLKQQTYADLLHCSRRSIGRALKELIQAKLLTNLNKRHLHRYKMYRLEGVLLSTPVKETKLSKDESHLLHQRICTQKQPENLSQRTKHFLDTYGPFWKQKFPKLNGQAGNPYLESCIEESLDYMSKNGMHRDPPGFVEIWLKHATEKYCQERV
ncbi:MAG: helix-turn-helix domain-containing protein [Myxococcaceae bacterium]